MLFDRRSSHRVCILHVGAVAPFGGTEGSLDVLLRERGLKREVILWGPAFTVAPFIVASTDLVATVPRRIAEAFSGPFSLQLLPAPLPVPGFTCSQLWHRRTEADPAHQWLRRFVSTRSAAQRLTHPAMVHTSQIESRERGDAARASML